MSNSLTTRYNEADHQRGYGKGDAGEHVNRGEVLGVTDAQAEPMFLRNEPKNELDPAVPNEAGEARRHEVTH